MFIILGEKKPDLRKGPDDHGGIIYRCYQEQILDDQRRRNPQNNQEDIEGPKSRKKKEVDESRNTYQRQRLRT